VAAFQAAPFFLLCLLLLICHCYIAIPLYYCTDILHPVYNAANIAELAVEKGATTLLILISAKRQLSETISNGDSVAGG